MRMATVFGAVVLSFLAIACGHRGPRTASYPVLPRNVRESVHRDYRHCAGRDVRGMDLGNGQYRVLACGLDVVYACPIGRHSRWQTCQQAGGGMAMVGAQPVTGGATVTVYTVDGSGSVATTAQPAVVATPAPAPATVQPTAPATTGPVPTPEQVEAGVRQWIDSQRASILACTQTQAALVEVSWTTTGTPSVALGGELHGTPGEGCVATALSGVQFNSGGQAGALRHVVQ